MRPKMLTADVHPEPEDGNDQNASTAEEYEKATQRILEGANGKVKDCSYHVITLERYCTSISAEGGFLSPEWSVTTDCGWRVVDFDNYFRSRYSPPARTV